MENTLAYGRVPTRLKIKRRGIHRSRGQHIDMKDLIHTKMKENQWLSYRKPRLNYASVPLNGVECLSAATFAILLEDMPLSPPSTHLHQPDGFHKFGHHDAITLCYMLHPQVYSKKPHRGIPILLYDPLRL